MCSKDLLGTKCQAWTQGVLFSTKIETSLLDYLFTFHFWDYHSTLKFKSASTS